MKQMSTAAATTTARPGHRDRPPRHGDVECPSARATAFPLLPGSRVLVVLAGLPGAGKSTLARSWANSTGVTVLDSEQITERLSPAARLVGYARVRPLVHALHLLRVGVALTGPTTQLVLTDPGTSPVRRRLVFALAHASGRRVHLRLLDVPAELAVAGQHSRQRVVPVSSMRRHIVRWHRLLQRLSTTGTITGADTVTVLTRQRSSAAAGR